MVDEKQNTPLYPSSDWGSGSSSDTEDPDALKAYINWLCNVRKIGEAAFWICLFLMVIELVFFFKTVNFEDVTFNDGTTHICVLDGKTGEIHAAK